jgi:hypothetical protein
VLVFVGEKIISINGAKKKEPYALLAVYFS